MKMYHLASGNAVKMQQLSALFKEVFEMEASEQPSEEYCERILNNENFIYVVAEENNEIVGGLSAFLMALVHGNSEVFVYDLAVASHLQRKGTGTALLEKLKQIAADLGADGVLIPAENEDDHAVKFYNKTGGEANNDVTLFWYSVKP